MPASGLQLTNSEQITLRRVAHGQSDAFRLPTADMARLRELFLIAGSARAPHLTPAGQRQFLTLARPVALKTFDAQGTLTALVERLQGRNADKRRRSGGQP
jgi:hypothetical protein